jgi:sodium-dependent phosphate cotransporter
MFNICAAIVLFPLEMYTGIIYRTATSIEHFFEGMGGLEFISPLSIVLDPVTKPIEHVIGNHILLIVLSFVMLLFSMSGIVRNMRGIVMQKVEHILNGYLFRNVLISMLFGCLLTALVQSSSITTSIIIPLVGAGVLTIEQIFPYTLGANIGTTITAFLAALVAVEHRDAAITIALCHLVFNMLGIFIFYPLKVIPIKTARMIAAFVSKSKKHFLVFLITYILLHIIPIVFAHLN